MPKRIFLSHPYSKEDTELIENFREALSANAIVHDEIAYITEKEAEQLSDMRFRYREPSIEAKKKIEAKIADSDEVAIIITKRWKYDAYGQFAFKTSPIVEYIISHSRKQDKRIVCHYEENVSIESLFPQLPTKISFNRRSIKAKKQIELELYKDERGNWRYSCDKLKISGGFCPLELVKELDEEYRGKPQLRK